MRLFHITTVSRKHSILATGIDPSYSQGKRRECWYVTADRLHWAILHVMARKQVQLGDVCVLDVIIPDDELTKRWRGIYTLDTVCYPGSIRYIAAATNVALAYPTDTPEELMGGG